MTANPSGWRPSAPANEQGEARTVTGNRALMLEEPLIFEMAAASDRVDFDFLPGTGRGTSEAGGVASCQAPAPLRQRFALPPPRPGEDRT